LLRDKPQSLASVLLAALLLILATKSLPLAFRTDDLATLEVVSLPWSAIWPQLQTSDVHPPLFFYLAKIWSIFFGLSEQSMHGLVLLIFVAFLGSGAWIGGRLGSWPLALLCASLLAASPLHWLAAGIVRKYTLLMLLALWSSYLFLNLANGFTRSRAAFYVFVTILGSFTHAWFFFCLFGQGLAALAFSRAKQWPRFAALWLLSLLPYLLLWLPGLWVVLPAIAPQMAWVPPLDGASLLSAAVLLLGPGALAFLFLRNYPGPEVIGYGLIGLGGLALPLAISIWKPMFYARFTVALSPLILLALAFWVAPRLRIPAAIAISLAALALAIGIRFEPPDCNPRALAQSLPGYNSDRYIFTSLSRRAVLQYNPSLAAQSASFPAVIDRHPNFEGDLYQESMRPLLTQEAALAIQEAGSITLIGGNRPFAENIVRDALRQAGFVPAAAPAPCLSAGDHMSQTESWVRPARD
jgi:hypothetical protein